MRQVIPITLLAMSVALVALPARAEDDAGVSGARDLNDATRDAGHSMRKFLPTWVGGKAINDQNSQNDKAFQEHDEENNNN